MSNPSLLLCTASHAYVLHHSSWCGPASPVLLLLHHAYDIFIATITANAYAYICIHKEQRVQCPIVRRKPYACVVLATINLRGWMLRVLVHPCTPAVLQSSVLDMVTPACAFLGRWTRHLNPIQILIKPNLLFTSNNGAHNGMTHLCAREATWIHCYFRFGGIESVLGTADCRQRITPPLLSQKSTTSGRREESQASVTAPVLGRDPAMHGFLKGFDTSPHGYSPHREAKQG